ncbi:aspartate--tRNA ligase [Patescibacteria group bacterium]|nr:aspartate--tRNA ligase [Patescibacteria group bacterium]
MKRSLALEAIKQIGKKVTLKGWVHSIRNMGGIVFVDLRDVSGIIQVVFDDTKSHLTKELGAEYVVEVNGKVVERGEKYCNPKIATGKVEVAATELIIINSAQTPPFEIDKEKATDEELRLKYRYLDIRHERIKNNLIARHKLINHIRTFLNQEGFIDVETPILSAPTPEGARDFLVPSRKYLGSFYALPQAPQQYKQLLMTAGIERYYQIAKCMRDEDSRGDRQPEFTQLDLEMSFVEREDVMALNEKLLIELVKTLYPKKRIQTIPFPRFTYAEAQKKFKTDRPDLREDKQDPDLLAFCWIVDFPFFEKDKSGGWTFTHNPFSAPMPESMPKLLAKKNVGEIVAAQYDVVLNGFEIGGGSIRNHEPKALQAALGIMGYSDDQIKTDFGHMLEAFSYGAPPHGGIAWGLDRLVMVLQNEPNIREVIAFPKTDKARDPMMGTPREANPEQLKELGISFKKSK